MVLFRKNIRLGSASDVSNWRKASLGLWKNPSDPSVYGFLDLDVSRALSYIREKAKQTGTRITITHFAARALGEMLRRHPEINRVLRWGRLYPRKSVDVFFLAAADRIGEQLSGVIVENADLKPVSEIAKEMQTRLERLRQGIEDPFRGMKQRISRVPGFLVGPLLNVVHRVLQTCNLWTPLFGCPTNAFGSVMVTNVGSLGLDMAFAPLVPITGVPLMISLGAVKEVPVARDGLVQTSWMMRLGATFDHRLIDGVHASHMATTLQKIFANPEAELDGVKPQRPVAPREVTTLSMTT